MLEKVALQLLNRFLGAYVENLDSTNLKLGIFSGNAVVENLRVRENALDDLDIPFRVKVGNIGRLTLKVPWKTMLTSSNWNGYATLDDVFIVLVPRAAMKYDPEKDRKERYESKSNVLEGLESTLADKLEVQDAKKGSQKEEKTDRSWIDKLVADCVRNFQVVIRNIHVRYEDSISNPHAPFACGVSFANLSYNIRTSNSAEVLHSLRWNADGSAVDDKTNPNADPRVCTQLCLESFAVYLDPASSIWSDSSRASAIDKMRDMVSNGSNYVLRPLRLDCALWIDLKPAASGYVRPQFEIACRLTKIEFELERNQYIGTMSTICEFQRVLIQSRYMRYDRPSEKVATSTRKWWHYAYRVIAQEKLQRELRKWKWSAMQDHMNKCRSYKALYRKTISGIALSHSEKVTLEELTVELDTFNIMRLRQRAAIELARAERDKEKEKQKQKQKKPWSSYLWSSSNKPSAAPTTDAEDRGALTNVMSKEEREQLRRFVENSAIGEGFDLDKLNSAPRSYVSIVLRARFDEVTLRLTDTTLSKPVAALCMRLLMASFSQRPSAKSIKLNAQMQSFAVRGGEHDALVVSSIDSDAGAADKKQFIAVSFETNPEHAEQISVALRAAVRPTHLFVDASTVKAALHFATLPRSVRFRKAVSTPQSSSSSMKNNVDAYLRKRYRNEVEIDIDPAVLVLPTGGVYKESQTATLALSFGRLVLRSVAPTEQQLAARAANVSCAADSAYDVYTVQLTDVQCILARSGENWNALLAKDDLTHQLIAPISINVALKLCALVDDPRFPEICVDAELRLLRVAVTDNTLRQALNVLLSIRQQLSFAVGESRSRSALRSSASIDSSVALDDEDERMIQEELHIDEIARLGREADADTDSISVSSGVDSDDEEQRVGHRRKRLAELEAKRRKDAESITLVAVQFEMSKLQLELYDETHLDVPLTQFDVSGLRTTFHKRTFDESASVQLDAISLRYRQFELASSIAVGAPTLKLEYQRVDEEAPSFIEKYQRTAMQINVVYERLCVSLHRERISDAAEYIFGKYSQLVGDWRMYEEATDDDHLARQIERDLHAAAAAAASDAGHATQKEEKGRSAFLISAYARSTVPLRFSGSVGQLAVAFSDDEQGTFASLQLDRFDTQLTMQYATMFAQVALGNLAVKDQTERTRYSDLIVATDTASQLMKIDVTLNDKVLLDRLSQNGISLFAPDAIVSDCDLQAVVGRVRFVYLQPLLNRIVQVFSALEVPLERMQDQLRDASKKMAIQAKNLQLVERVITVDTRLDAPVIVVPRAAEDTSHFTVNLGNLRLSRSYAMDQGRLSNTIQVSLTDLGLSADSRSLIDPVSFSFAVRFSHDDVRNEEGAIATPKLHVEARLGEVRVSVHEEDATLLAAVYRDNVSTYVHLFQSDSGKDDQHDDDAATKQDTAVAQGEAGRDQLQSAMGSMTKIQMQIGLHVTFERLTVVMCSNNPAVTSSGQLALFQLSTLTLNANFALDQQIDVILSLALWSLDDQRIAAKQPNYSGITRLLDNGGNNGQVSKSGDENDLFTFSLSILPNKEIKANVDIDGVSVCASVEFVNVLVGYLNSITRPLIALQNTDADADADAEADPKAGKNNVPQRRGLPPNVASESASASTPMQMEARFCLRSSQLALVERIETRTSDALVLCFESRGRFRMPELNANRFAFECELKLSDLLCCPFDPAARSGRTSRVLEPCTMHAVVNRTDIPAAMRINVEAETLALHVSPPLIRFAGAILQAVLDSVQPEKPAQDAEVHRYDDVLVPVDFWRTQPLPAVVSPQDTFWYLAQNDSDGMESTVDVACEIEESNENALLMPSEHLFFNFPRVAVNVEDAGDSKSAAPLLYLETAFSGEVREWSSSMNAEVSGTLLVAYYNHVVGLWEPLIEPVELPDSTFAPFPFDVKLRANANANASARVSRDNRSVASFSTLDTDTDFDSDDDDDDGATSVRITSPHVLNCTLTDVSVRLLLKTAERFTSVFKLQSSAFESSTDANFSVYNETGTSLAIALDSSRFRFVDPSNPSMIELGVLLEKSSVLHLHEISSAATRLRTPPSPLRPDSNNAHLRSITGGVTAASLVTYIGVATQRDSISFDMSLLDSVQGDPLTIELSGCSETKALRLPSKGQPAKSPTVTRSLRTPPSVSQNDAIATVIGVYVTTTLQKIEVRLRSAVQVRNEFSVPIAISTASGLRSPSYWITLRPKAEAYLPVPLATSDTSLYFAPLTIDEMQRLDDSATPEYHLSAAFKVFERNDAVLVCARVDNPFKSFVVKVCANITKYDAGAASNFNELYTYTLRPLARFTNLLPAAVDIKQDMQAKQSSTAQFADHWDIEGGLSVDFCDIQFAQAPLEIIFNYCGSTWRASWLMVHNPPPVNYIQFSKSSDSSDRTVLTIMMHSEYTAGVLCVTLYASYWLLNKTGLSLIYEFHRVGQDGSRRVEQPADMVDPIILSTKPKWLRKENVSFTVKGQDCGFTEAFSLDAVGTTGKVECKKSHEGRAYQFGVKIELSKTQRTKIITITPYFMILNHLNRDVRVLDSVGNSSTLVLARDVSPVWPMVQSSSRYRLSIELQLRHRDIDSTVDSDDPVLLYSPPFSLHESMQSLFRLTDAGALCIDVRASEDSVTVIIDGYKPGLCPVRIVNDTKQTLFVRQAKSVVYLELPSSSSVMFALSDTDLPKAVEWKVCGSNPSDAPKSCDLNDSFATSPDGAIMQICFMDGAQRVLLFTDREHVAITVFTSARASQPQFDMVLQLNAIGLSLVNTAIRQEILYARLFSRGVLWRKRKSAKSGSKEGRLQPIDADLAGRIEAAYQRFLNSGRRSDLAELKQGEYEINFSSEPPVMRKPTACTLKRSCEPGIWAQLRSNTAHNELHLKIQLLQVDSPLRDAQFTTLLAVVPPRSTSGDEYQEFLTRPFFELSLVLDKQARVNVLQFKFLKVLMQEIFVHVDRAAIVALLGFVMEVVRRKRDMFTTYQLDRALAAKSLRDRFFDEFGGGSEQIHYFGLLHLSPIKLNLSIALGGEQTQTQSQAQDASQLKEHDEQSSEIDNFLQLTGISVVEASDILLKLAFFERKNRFYTQTRLVNEVASHYLRIAIRQLLKFVLGLDVIGNPYGVFRDVQRGFEDLFYEPVNGAMEGPREFAQGMQQGVTSLVKNTVGGVAGGMSRLTGALGKALATATFDDKFQQERMNKLRNRKTDSVSKNLATGAASVVISVGQAAAGVFTKPVEGAKSSGAAGFFMGIGKGIIGLVAVPASTVVDAASTAFHSVHRATDSRHTVQRIRLPRYIGPRTPLRAYMSREANGALLLSNKRLAQNTPFDTDEYVFHAVLTSKPNFQSMMIVTDLRVVLITRENLSDIRHWRNNLTLWLDELTALPTWAPQGAKFATRDPKLGSYLNKASSQSGGNYTFTLQFEDVHLGQFVVALISQILKRKHGFA